MMLSKMKLGQNLPKSTSDLEIPSDNTISNWVNNPYVKAASSDNTRKAYRSDIRHYEQWGGLLPATPDKIIEYLQNFAETLNSRTLSRRLIAIKHWHTYQGFPDPTTHPLVAKTMLGITRIHGKPKVKAPPLSPADLAKIVKALAQNSALINIRDSAILQLGYFGALRRSEIIDIRYEHIHWRPEGIEILLLHSKTDQMHEGQYCAIPYGNETLCPIKALKHWLEASGIQDGAIFRRIFKNNFLSEKSLTPLSINHIVQRSALLANISSANDISPHSLRRGFATYAAHAHASIKTIMRAGRWKQVNTVMEYIEASERFNDSAAASIFINMQNGQ